MARRQHSHGQAVLSRGPSDFRKDDQRENDIHRDCELPYLCLCHTDLSIEVTEFGGLPGKIILGKDQQRTRILQHLSEIGA